MEFTLEIYVGNLSYEATSEGVKALFETFGQVESVTLPFDKANGRLKGFGFVKMPQDGEASEAIKYLSGSDFLGRSLKVNPSRGERGKS